MLHSYILRFSEPSLFYFSLWAVGAVFVPFIVAQNSRQSKRVSPLRSPILICSEKKFSEVVGHNPKTMN